MTGDMEFLKDQAAEVLVETARVWADVGCFAESRGGKYCICAVTGPDEYNAIVDNNFYTNLMARENIRDAGWALDTLRAMDEAAWEALVAKLGVKEEERALWNRIVENMYFPYDEGRKVYPLDDGFMMRKPWTNRKYRRRSAICSMKTTTRSLSSASGCRSRPTPYSVWCCTAITLRKRN